MTPEQLKASILQYAIQGKLVEQRPEEGTGEELYRQIQTEKQRLIKEGKIKKEKPLPEITEDEIPFDIPESWKWVRVGNVFNVGTGMTPLKTEVKFYQNGTIPWVTSSLTSQRYIADAETKITEYALENTSLAIYPAHTLIVAMYGQGKTRGQVSELLIDATVNQACAALGNIVMDKCLVAYTYYFFLFNYEMLRRKAEGTSQPNLNVGKIKETLIPLPPLAEQHRIVAKIEKLLPYVDRYAAAYKKLEQFNAKFPEDMKKSILQYAIQGKLVEQRPEEGTGEELYRQIQAEKQRLIKEGKIKKEKPLAAIGDDEIPFEVPESWKWVRLPAVADMCLGKMLDKQKNAGMPMPYLRNVNVRWGAFDLSDLLEMKFEDIEDERYLIQKNDIVMCEGGEPGRCAVWTENTTIHFQKALHRIRLVFNLSSVFFYYVFCLYAKIGIFSSLFTGTTIKHLTGQSLDKIIVPLPPLLEQRRIVAKLEAILPLCERLK